MHRVSVTCSPKLCTSFHSKLCWLFAASRSSLPWGASWCWQLHPEAFSWHSVATCPALLHRKQCIIRQNWCDKSSFLCASLQAVSGQVIGTGAIIADNITLTHAYWVAEAISLGSSFIIVCAWVSSCYNIMASILDDAWRSHLTCCGSPDTNAQTIHHSPKSRPSHCKFARYAFNVSSSYLYAMNKSVV